jgi:hypothetical protein
MRESRKSLFQDTDFSGPTIQQLAVIWPEFQSLGTSMARDNKIATPLTFTISIVSVFLLPPLPSERNTSNCKQDVVGTNDETRTHCFRQSMVGHRPSTWLLQILLRQTRAEPITGGILLSPLPLVSGSTRYRRWSERPWSEFPRQSQRPFIALPFWADGSCRSQARAAQEVHRGGSYLCTDQDCPRYRLHTRGKEEISTGTNHSAFAV